LADVRLDLDLDLDDRDLELAAARTASRELTTQLNKAVSEP
jgi:hypothetical protein